MLNIFFKREFPYLNSTQEFLLPKRGNIVAFLFPKQVFQFGINSNTMMSMNNDHVN
jgi:hypothetical protein